LLNEVSPYLLQHAHNPVDWYPWSEEAFEKARKENKPVFLSIGYSTCHWCHVMERESFEDPEVARLMNETFVSIKVDREERPDIDNVYMSVCQMLTGGGGWPLTIVMTPDKEPFFAGTYFPKNGRFGRPGMMQILPRIGDAWTARRDDILSSASEITAALRRSATPSPPRQALGEMGDGLDKNTLKIAYEQLAERFDERHGGFDTGTKFPTPHNLLFLLRYWKRSGDSKALQMVERTLQAMRLGGICDHVGFGFHRYATDRRWLVPHFEKMLYDQALLAMAYTEAYLATGKPVYGRTVREILTYVLRDMTAAEGGFYSAEDADSKGEEGKFYVWTEQEIRKVLRDEDADLIVKVFNVESGGNYTDQATREKTGASILHFREPIKDVSASLRMTERELEARLEPAAQTLFAEREKRVHPHKDDKILTDWNGLMIAALAKGARAFGEPEYTEAARRAADFILREMRKTDGRLLHRFRNGEAAIQANVDDYAFMIWGLIELYEATFEAHYLKLAIDFDKHLTEHFWDHESGGFFFTPDDGEQLLVRRKETYDGAVPSGNSVAMLNLLRLSRMTADVDLEARAERISRAFAKDVVRRPAGHTQLMAAVDFAVGPSREIILVGDRQGKDTGELLTTLWKQFMPNTVAVLRPKEVTTDGITRMVPFTKNYHAVGGKATAYVCRNYSCKKPVTDPGEFARLLRQE